MQRCMMAIVSLGQCLVLAGLASAQAVQLPTFNYFTVQTTVSVPDRGGMYLGGVDRASSGSTSRGFGPLRSQGSGASVRSSGVSVHATIIDNNELDQAVLAEARRRRGDQPLMLRHLARQRAPEASADAPTLAKAEFLSRSIASREVENAPTGEVESVDSLADIRARAAARNEAKQAEAAAKFAAGLAAQEAGKFASARGYFEAAARMGNEELRQQALQRLAAIALPTPARQRVVNK